MGACVVDGRSHMALLRVHHSYSEFDRQPGRQGVGCSDAEVDNVVKSPVWAPSYC